MLVFAGLLIGQAGDFAGLSTRANQARDANRFDEAINLYQQALGIKSDWAEGWWNVGTLLYDRDDYAGAASAFKKAVDANPKVGIAFVMLGLAEAQLGKDEQALEHIEKGRLLGVEANPELRRVVLFTKATLLLRTLKFGEAREDLAMLSRDGESQPELDVAFGEAALAMPPARFETADADLKERVRRVGQAERLAARREFGAGQKIYEAVLAQAPDLPNLNFAYGRFLVDSHQDEQAIGAFEKELAHDPNHLPSLLGIAALKQTSDAGAGLRYAEKAVQLAPKLAEPHYLLGMSLLATDKTARAIEELEAARRFSPEEAKIYFALGKAYARAKRDRDAAQARAEFERLQRAEAP